MAHNAAMNTRVRIAFAVAVIGATAFLMWRCAPPPDPVYHGKALSAWLREYAKQPVSFYDGAPPQGEAVDAIRTIGTNAIPLLLRLTEARGSSVGWQIKKLVGGHFHWIDNPKNFSRHLAWCGFQALGSSGQTAVPALTKLMDDGDTETRRTAVVCLGYIGPAPRASVPALIRRVEADGNVEVRSCAILSLGKIHSQPDLVLPVLIRLLQTPSGYDDSVRNRLIVDSLSVLPKFGERARAALPTIRPLAGERDYNVRYWADRVLKELSPDGAARLDAADVDGQTSATNRF